MRGCGPQRRSIRLSLTHTFQFAAPQHFISTSTTYTHISMVGLLLSPGDDDATIFPQRAKKNKTLQKKKSLWVKKNSIVGKLVAVLRCKYALTGCKVKQSVSGWIDVTHPFGEEPVGSTLGRVVGPTVCPSPSGQLIRLVATSLARQRLQACSDCEISHLASSQRIFKMRKAFSDIF